MSAAISTWPNVVALPADGEGLALICGGDRETSKGSETVTGLAFVHLHDPMAVARRNVLHGMKCHRLFAFLARRADGLDVFLHGTLHTLLQAGAQHSQPPTRLGDALPVVIPSMILKFSSVHPTTSIFTQT
jgi:hypothetical protein